MMSVPMVQTQNQNDDNSVITPTLTIHKTTNGMPLIDGIPHTPPSQLRQVRKLSFSNCLPDLSMDGKAPQNAKPPQIIFDDFGTYIQQTDAPTTPKKLATLAGDISPITTVEEVNSTIKTLRIETEDEDNDLNKSPSPLTQTPSTTARQLSDWTSNSNRSEITTAADRNKRCREKTCNSKRNAKQSANKKDDDDEKTNDNTASGGNGLEKRGKDKPSS